MIFRQSVIDMINEGMIPMKYGAFIDAYNHCVCKIPPTITTRISSSNNYFVTVFE